MLLNNNKAAPIKPVRNSIAQRITALNQEAANESQPNVIVVIPEDEVVNEEINIPAATTSLAIESTAEYPQPIVQSVDVLKEIRLLY